MCTSLYLYVDEAGDAWLCDTVGLSHQLAADLSPQWEEGLVVSTGGCRPIDTH